jgi:hypothetical protein
MNKYKLILSDESTKYFKFDSTIDSYIQAFDEMLDYMQAIDPTFQYVLVFKGHEGNNIVYKIMDSPC